MVSSINGSDWQHWWWWVDDVRWVIFYWIEENDFFPIISLIKKVNSISKRFDWKDGEKMLQLKSNGMQGYVRATDQQWIGFALLIITLKIFNISESTMHPDSIPFIHSPQCWIISTGCNEYAYNVDIKLIPFKICLIPSTLEKYFLWYL